MRLVVLLRGASRPGDGVVALDRTLRARLPEDDLLVSVGFDGVCEHHGTSLRTAWVASSGNRNRRSVVAESEGPAPCALVAHPWFSRPVAPCWAALSEVVASPGLAPGSSRSSGARLNCLSYLARCGGEPGDRTLQGRDLVLVSNQPASPRRLALHEVAGVQGLEPRGDWSWRPVPTLYDPY